MANFGQQHSLTLQPIYEGDIQEPSFADITDTQAIWPADSGAILHCDPKALIRISIKSGCDDAPYRERDVDNPDWEPKREDVEFWDRVKANADRISEWALSGLAIPRRARPLGDGEPIGRASCRERVCQSVSTSVVDSSLKKKHDTIKNTTSP